METKSDKIYRDLRCDPCTEEAHIRTHGWVKLQHNNCKACENHRKKRKRKYQHTKGHINDAECVMLQTGFPKSPGWAKVTGKLSECNSLDIIRQCDKYDCMFHNCDVKTGYTRLQNMIVKMSGMEDDVGIMQVVAGYYYYADFPCKQMAKHMQKLLQKVTTFSKYNVDNENIVKSQINFYLYGLYYGENKIGKAYSAMTAAHQSVQNLQPSQWTARVYGIQCRMYDLLAHITPRERKRYRSMALKAAATAREHSLHDEAHGIENKYYNPILYSLYMVHLILGVPIFATLFRFTNLPQCHILYNYLKVTEVEENELSKAHKLIDWATKHAQTVNAMTVCKRKPDEMIFIASTILSIREMQVTLQSQDHCEANLLTLKALNQKFECNLNQYPEIKRDIYHIILDLEDDLTLKSAICGLTNEQYALSCSPGSLTSELSDNAEEMQDAILALKTLEDEEVSCGETKDHIESDVNM